MSEKKTPAILFQWFTDDWEQQTLGNILITLPFKPYMKSPEQNGKYEIIQQGNEPIAGHANGSPCLNYTDLVIFGDHTLSLFKPESPFFVATDGVRILKGKDNMNRNYLLLMIKPPQVMLLFYITGEVYTKSGIDSSLQLSHFITAPFLILITPFGSSLHLAISFRKRYSHRPKLHQGSTQLKVGLCSPKVHFLAHQAIDITLG